LNGVNVGGAALLAERRKPPGGGEKTCRPGAKTMAPKHRCFGHIQRLGRPGGLRRSAKNGAGRVYSFQSAKIASHARTDSIAVHDDSPSPSPESEPPAIPGPAAAVTVIVNVRTNLNPPWSVTCTRTE